MAIVSSMPGKFLSGTKRRNVRVVVRSGARSAGSPELPEPRSLWQLKECVSGRRNNRKCTGARKIAPSPCCVPHTTIKYKLDSIHWHTFDSTDDDCLFPPVLIVSDFRRFHRHRRREPRIEANKIRWQSEKVSWDYHVHFRVSIPHFCMGNIKKRSVGFGSISWVSPVMVFLADFESFGWTNSRIDILRCSDDLWTFRKFSMFSQFKPFPKIFPFWQRFNTFAIGHFEGFVPFWVLVRVS